MEIEEALLHLYKLSQEKGWEFESDNVTLRDKKS